MMIVHGVIENVEIIKLNFGFLEKGYGNTLYRLHFKVEAFGDFFIIGQGVIINKNSSIGISKIKQGDYIRGNCKKKYFNDRKYNFLELESLEIKKKS